MQAYRHRIELDRFDDEAANLAAAGVCEGDCEEHRGECRAVRVVHSDGTDWGWFSYCEEARATDFNNGFWFPDAS